MSRFLNTTVARKFAMGISGLFLVLYLLLHVTVNFTSTVSPHFFNILSEYLGYNFIVQFILQPILMIGIIFHFILAFILEYKNKKARSIQYVSFKKSRNTTWMSRNMLYSGLVILAFLILHFYDFWIPEMSEKFGHGYTGPENPSRFYEHIVAEFQDPWRVILYVIAFILLMLHLLHGFYGSFQSVGWGDRNSRAIRGFTKWFSIIVPLVFIYIALFHYFSH